MKQIYRLYGIPCRIHCTPLLIALTLSLFLWLPATSHAQVNSYAKVIAITTNSGRSVLTISNRNQTYHTFAAGEQVIVIQMQENVIGGNTNNNATFGNLSAIGNAGFYDVATIYSVTTTTMTLTGLLSATFTIGANSSVQVVSFHNLSTGSFITSANITAVPWNSSLGTGGVVAFQVPGTLTLNHSISADGNGFTGGAISFDYENQCEPSVYRTNSTNYAAKGEGIYKINTAANANYVRGRAKIISGGGGGSDLNAGGAGGGNFSAGGAGGPGYTCNGANASGGLGGIALNTYLTTGTRLFMGGGGGGGQGDDGLQTAGANGGGIVIIKANVITTGCASTTVRISANGSNSGSTTGAGYDGAGGAGAGGTILLAIGSFSVPGTCMLQIQANGGGGGNVNSNLAHGGGGGGGQGAVLFSGAIPTTNVSTVTVPGLGGLNSTPGGTRAGSGTGSNNAGVIGGIGVVLPVRLLHFSAENTNKKAVLHWTAGDDANTLFTVQHSTDGVNFTTIGTVKGTGNSNTTTNYTFTDDHAVPGKNYYQLQMSGDPTAQTSYSGIVSVNMTDMQSIPVAWPNPAHDHFSVRVSDAYSNKNHQVIITDLTGKLMYTNYYKPANGIITVTPVSPLKPGMYMFKLSSEGYEQSGKLIIR